METHESWNTNTESKENQWSILQESDSDTQEEIELTEYPEDYDAEEDDYSDGYESEDDDEENYDWRLEVPQDEQTLRTYSLPTKILERYDFIEKLPSGVAVMGGTARSIAREILTGEREPIRDIDLVNISDENGESKVDWETLDDLAEKYMPDDYAYGHGIQSETLNDYFLSRDFTINQSLVLDGKLLISEAAYNDFEENIIRPTYYETQDGWVSGRIFLKSILMQSVVSRFSSSVPTVEDVQTDHEISDFDLALFLNKAMSRGAEVAREFTYNLADWDVISEDYAGRPLALAKEVIGNTWNFEFRLTAEDQYNDPLSDEPKDSLLKPQNRNHIPNSMTHYHASSPIIRAALAEYEDGENTDRIQRIHDDDPDERKTGRYTQKDMDEINYYANVDDYYDDDEDN
ncbi:MAG: hypothetical protein Q4C83_02045 [Candidatus Saccharibacteria bacterium]|nr:hypothetical protein [Candidatus Saccharibacteria bacterium]